METLTIAGLNDTIVLIHDGIGCCKLWKEFPFIVNKETNKNVFAYSRHNHGNSDKDNEFSYYKEVDKLNDLLKSKNIEEPILFGHSDGAAIALLYAGKYPVKKVIVSAPHIKYEETMVYPLTRLKERFEAGGMPELSEAHQNVDNMFYSWYNRVTGESFKLFDITENLKGIKCPVEAMRFISDPYSSNNQIEWLCKVVPQTKVTLISGNNHTIHKRYPEIIIDKL